MTSLWASWGLLVCRAAVVDDEVVGVLAHVGAEARIRNVLALVSVIADEDGDPSGPAGRLRDEPRRGSPKLPVVGADIARPVRGGLVGDVGDDRLASSPEGLNGLCDQADDRRQSRLRHRNPRRAPSAALRSFRARADLDELDHGLDLRAMPLARGFLDLPSEQLIELAARLLKEKAEAVMLHRLLLAGIDHAEPVIADLVGRVPDPLDRGRAHRGRPSRMRFTVDTLTPADVARSAMVGRFIASSLCQGVKRHLIYSDINAHFILGSQHPC